MELSSVLRLSARGRLSWGTEQMSDVPCQMPIRDLMLNNAQTRAVHHRQQAAELRRMAENQTDESVRGEFLDLAANCDALANSVSAK